MQPKTLKIFLASSSELKNDREDFRTFIGIQNDRLKDQGVYLQIVQWEYFLDAIADTSLQGEYNKAIVDCDVVLCLFFTKVGKYTAEEFDTAYQVFKERGRPLIWTYFKDAPYNIDLITDEINTLLAFKKKIGTLGHFYTKYTNIDNLKYQFREQLDKILPAFTAPQGSNVPNNNAPITASADVPPFTFNEQLTRRLVTAIQPYSKRAKQFLENATRRAADWETQDLYSDPAKEIIAGSFVGVIGIQLRKLMAIGKERFSDKKINTYLQNCQLTARRTLQLLCFTLLSKLWDFKKDNNFTLTPEQATNCQHFFDDEYELDITSAIDLIKTLIAIYADISLELPIPELNTGKGLFDEGSPLVSACNRLQAIDKLLKTGSGTAEDCLEAEENITTVLENLALLANYKMVSIKNIDYYEMRNSKPHYLYNYTTLGIDVKANINKERVNYADAPTNTDAVLLYKGNYQQSVNLFPFVIDVNALTFESGAKICFYACHDHDDDSLNYTFLEDNTFKNIPNKETIKPGIDINEVLMDKEKRKDMRFDAVYALFHEAKKTITQTEEEEEEEENSPF